MRQRHAARFRDAAAVGNKTARDAVAVRDAICAQTVMASYIQDCLLDPLVPDLRRRATSSRCRGARAGDWRDLLQQRFLRLRQIERITVGLMISGASVPVDLDQIFFQISEIKGE